MQHNKWKTCSGRTSPLLKSTSALGFQRNIRSSTGFDPNHVDHEGVQHAPTPRAVDGENLLEQPDDHVDPLPTVDEELAQAEDAMDTAMQDEDEEMVQ